MAALAVLVIASPAHAGSGPPNVLVIVTDDQRDGTLGVMPRTRRFFQAGGRTFERAFVTTPLCCPSRASLFTGLYAHNHGVQTNSNGGSLPQGRTIQRYLADAGYATAMAGKYLNGFAIDRDPPYFNRWAVAQRHTYWNAFFNLDGTMTTLPGYTTNVLAAQAVRFLRAFEANDLQPWFLYVAPTAPHAPWTPAPKYADAPLPGWRPNPAVFESDKSDKPPWFRNKSTTLASIRARRSGQLRTLMSVDDLVGRVAETLGTLGERRNTIALFTSDNGYLWGEHGLKAKSKPYTPSISIPVLLRWPGRVAPGSRDWRNASMADVAPTILNAAGVTPAQPMDGRSLLQPWTREHLFTEHFENRREAVPDWASIRTRRMQYVEYYNDDRSDVVFREYYRLGRDPWQLTNVLRDGNRANNPRTGPLHRLLRSYRACAGTSCP